MCQTEASICAVFAVQTWNSVEFPLEGKTLSPWVALLLPGTFKFLSAWNFRANSTKEAFVHHLISCFVLVPPSNCCHTHSHGTLPASYDASTRRSLRAPVVVVVGTSFSAISVPNTAQGNSDGGIVCLPSETWLQL